MKKFFENLIMFIIILVVFYTIIEEIAILNHFSNDFKNGLIIAGFCFDLIFTLEFIIRLSAAIKRKSAKNYITAELGWIDFLSSIPLLALNSGPMIYLLITHDSFNAMNMVAILNVLKIAKIIRVARILRMMRFLKLLKNLKFIHSHITQRHINYILTAVITFIMLTVVGFHLTRLWDSSVFNNIKRQSYTVLFDQTMKLSLENSKDFLDVIKPMLEKDPEVFLVEYEKKPIYHSKKEFHLTELVFSDAFSYNRLTIHYINQEAHQIEARFYLFIIGLIIILITGMMILYARKFALEISDTVQIIDKGISDPEYFLKIVETGQKDDELDSLSKTYNDIWLPLKLKYKDEIYPDLQNKVEKEAEQLDLESFLK